MSTRVRDWWASSRRLGRAIGRSQVRYEGAHISLHMGISRHFCHRVVSIGSFICDISPVYCLELIRFATSEPALYTVAVHDAA
jgi:hypothetical protein